MERTEEDPMPFSEDLLRLENIVRRLEEESLPLENALLLFREGMETLHICRKFLRETSQEVRLLSDRDAEDLEGMPWTPLEDPSHSTDFNTNRIGGGKENEE